MIRILTTGLSGFSVFLKAVRSDAGNRLLKTFVLVVAIVTLASTAGYYGGTAQARLSSQQATGEVHLGEVHLGGADSITLRGRVDDAEMVQAFKEDRRCMALAVYHEARGESYEGQFAIAEVILNRVESEHYPNSICAVVYQGAARKTGCQFSWTCDGRSDMAGDKAAWQRANEIVQHALNDRATIRVTRGATHYHAKYVNPLWAKTLTRTTQIGRHIFYRSTSYKSS